MNRIFNAVIILLVVFSLCALACAGEGEAVAASAPAWLAALSALWAFANSPLGITLAASAALYLLNKIYNAKPEWQQYEGTIINAIKWAETNLSDDTGNSSVAKFDAALKYVLAVYARRNQISISSVPAAVVESLSEGINLLQAKAEERGLLHAPRTSRKPAGGKK